MSLNDSLQKSPTKRSKRSLITDSTESHNGNDLISKSGALVTINSDSDQSLENQLRIDNAHLQLQLEAGFKIIENLKKNINSYEGIVQNLNSAENKNISITENSEIVKFLRVLYSDNSELNSDKRSKRNMSRENTDTDFIHDKERLRNSSHIAEISQLEKVIKKYKEKIIVLKRKLDAKPGHASDSPTETNGTSTHSIYRPKIYRKSINGKRGRPKKNRIGRPRKSAPTNESTSTGTDTKPKRSIGRPRKSHSERHLTKSFDSGEPVEKKARGRPKTILEKDLLNNTASKINNAESVESSKSEEEYIDNIGISSERKRSPRKLPFNEDIAASGDAKKGRGRPKKMDVTVSEKQARGQTGDDEKGAGDLNESRIKSRGRPKKVVD